MQSHLETEQVVLDNMVIWTLKLCDQTSLVPYLTENRSISRSLYGKYDQRTDVHMNLPLYYKYLMFYDSLFYHEEHLLQLFGRFNIQLINLLGRLIIRTVSFVRKLNV